jgi:hypothetical protein
MKRALFAVLVALPALTFAREEEPSAWRQLCEGSGAEFGCERAPRIPDSVGRARPIVRAAPAPQPTTIGSGRVTGSGYFDPVEGGRTGVGIVHLQGEISVSRPDGARGVIRVRGEGRIPDDASDGTSISVRFTGSGPMTLNGQPAGRQNLDFTDRVALRVSGTYVMVEDVVSFGTVPAHSRGCEDETPSAGPAEKIP